MIRKTVNYFACTISAALLLACSQPESLNIASNAIISIQNADESPNAIEISDANPATVDIRIKAEDICDQLLVITFKANISKVEEYNKKNGTSYLPIPSESFEFVKDKVLLPRYNKISSTAQIVLNNNGMNDTDRYLLPLDIDSISGCENVEINENANTYYIVCKKKALPPAISIDRSDWKILYCKSYKEETNQGIKTGNPEDILDGDPKTYWKHNHKISDVSVPFPFVIDMGQEVYIEGIKLTSRRQEILNENSGPTLAPSSIKIELANSISGDGMENDNDYFYSETFGPDIILNQMVNYASLAEKQKARFIRFTYLSGYTADGLISKKGGSLAEFEVLGKTQD